MSPRTAFTWGVLDRLRAESWLKFDGISGLAALVWLSIRGWRVLVALLPTAGALAMVLS